MFAEPGFVYDLFQLKNQVVILTGGLGQLGTEFAETLLKANGRVAIFDLSDVPMGRLRDLELMGYPITFHAVDITNEERVRAAVDSIESVWGVPTILINNAGWKASPHLPPKASVPFEKYPMDVWDDVMRINTTGAAICAKVVGGNMIQKKRNGVIVNVSSHYALVSPDQRIYEYREKTGKGKFVKDASYSASKAALLALTRNLAVEWAQYGIRVNALCPGGVRNARTDLEFIEGYTNHVPLRRMAEADEYNAAMLFLVSDASQYMTGQQLVVDGGYTAL